MTIDLGKQIRTLREERKLLQSDVAAFLKISTSAYGHYEQGKREPDLETLRQIAIFFGVKFCYLVGEADADNNCGSTLKEPCVIHSVEGYDELDEAGQVKVLEYIELLKIKHKKK